MAENGILDYQGMNQAIYRGATSNIVVDTQSMSIEIGAGNTSHTSNLHFECNHDANVASIKLNSNVTTEFSRSKKLIKYPRVAMTQNDESGTSGYVTNASSWENQANNETYGPWNNFNGILNDSAWQSYPRRFSQTTGDWDGTTTAPYAISLVGGTTIYGEWVELKIPNKIQLHTCRISPLTSTTYPNLGKHRSPRDGYILGRVGATGNWTVLKSWSDVIHGWEDLVLRDFDIENPSEYYDYFRVVWTAINGNNNYSTSAGAGYASSGEIEFLGLPEYDPGAYGTDVTLKSVPNVPNTDWLEVYYDAKNYTNGVVQDETSNDIDATIGAATTFDSVNKAWSFSGASNRDGTEFVSGYLPSDFEGNQVHSVSMWLKFDYWHEGAFCIIGKENRANNDNHKAIHFQFQDTSSARPRILYDFWDNQKSFYLPDDVQPGKWLHMTATYTGNAAIRKMFVNGQELTTFTTNSNYATALALDTTNDLVVRLGTRYPVNSLYIFHGDIANFRLFNRVLTSDEVWQLYAYQKEYFGHGDLSMTLKAGRLGIGTSEPRAALDVRGDIHANGAPAFPIPVATFYKLSASTTNTTHDENIRSGWVAFTGANTITPGVIEAYTLSGGTTTQGTSSGVVVKLCKKGMYKLEAGFAINTQSGINSHIGIGIYPVSDSYIPGNNSRVHYTLGGAGSLAGYFYIPGATNNINQQFRMTEILRVSEGPGYAYVTMTPNSNDSTHFQFQNWANYPHGVMYVTYLG